eukprot:1161548-Pelagomonas_calceolata.AAC.5
MGCAARLVGCGCGCECVRAAITVKMLLNIGAKTVLDECGCEAGLLAGPKWLVIQHTDPACPYSIRHTDSYHIRDGLAIQHTAEMQ